MFCSDGFELSSNTSKPSRNPLTRAAITPDWEVRLDSNRTIPIEEMRHLMKYFNGHDVFTGDKVIADESEGVVVSVLDTKQFSPKYPEGWSNEVDGAFVET